jgi:hypothetical protein
MPRTSYNWTAEQWAAYYWNRAYNLFLLNIANTAAAAFAVAMALSKQIGPDGASLLPALMLCINLAVIYTFLDDIHDGRWAGIAFGATFGVPMLSFVVGLDYHLSPIYALMAGLATAVGFILYAMRFYAGHPIPVPATSSLSGRRGRY